MSAPIRRQVYKAMHVRMDLGGIQRAFWGLGGLGGLTIWGVGQLFVWWAPFVGIAVGVAVVFIGYLTRHDAAWLPAHVQALGRPARYDALKRAPFTMEIK
jgi:hypothetical protein